MTELQMRFVEEYFNHKGNCYAAAIAAGYAEKTAKESSRWINPNTLKDPNKTKLYKKDVVAAIEARRAELNAQAEKQAAAEGRELAIPERVTSFLVGVLDGTETDKRMILCGDGDPRYIDKPVTVKDKMAAAASLIKIFGMEKTNINVNGSLPVTIIDDIPKVGNDAETV